MQNNKFVPTPEMIQSAYSVFKCMAYIEAIRPEVESYEQRVINEMQPVDKRTGEVITSPEHAHRMANDTFKQYVERLDIEACKVGLNVRPGYCPLLVAKEDLRQAKRRLINAMEPVTKLSHDKMVTRGFEYYDELVELTLKFLSPFISNYHKATS